MAPSVLGAFWSHESGALWSMEHFKFDPCPFRDLCIPCCPVWGEHALSKRLGALPGMALIWPSEHSGNALILLTYMTTSCQVMSFTAGYTGIRNHGGVTQMPVGRWPQVQHRLAERTCTYQRQCLTHHKAQK